MEDETSGVTGRARGPPLRQDISQELLNKNSLNKYSLTQESLNPLNKNLLKKLINEVIKNHSTIARYRRLGKKMGLPSTSFLLTRALGFLTNSFLFKKDSFLLALGSHKYAQTCKQH